MERRSDGPIASSTPFGPQRYGSVEDRHDQRRPTCPSRLHRGLAAGAPCTGIPLVGWAAGAIRARTKVESHCRHMPFSPVTPSPMAACKPDGNAALDCFAQVTQPLPSGAMRFRRASLEQPAYHRFRAARKPALCFAARPSSRTGTPRLARRKPVSVEVRCLRERSPCASVTGPASQKAVASMAHNPRSGRRPGRKGASVPLPINRSRCSPRRVPNRTGPASRNR